MTDATFSAAMTPPLGADHIAAKAPGPKEPGRRVRYDGRSLDLFWIYLKNLVLTFVTLGIYRFWATTRIRRFIWSHLRFLDEPFEYVGTGKELFLGFLKAMLALIPIFIGLGVLDFLFFQFLPEFYWASELLRFTIIMSLIYLGTYAAQRYRMSRTLWRGIRFQQAGSAWVYLGLAMRGLLLTVLTLGLYTPFVNVRLKSYEMNNLSFGSQPFAFDGQGKDLFKPFLIAWALALPTLFLSMFWFAARSYRYYASRLSVAGLRFAMPVTGLQVAWLQISNLLLLVVSLGLLYPVVVRRTLDFWCQNLAVEGAVDFKKISQAEQGPKTGEGLASYFGMDAVGV
ncbi:DUF898 family protein [Rhodospirillaceae bacterium SYSU D60014]|uniref:YjgN family protein n=1 Tax=Virgifigura deserti TaxID=2268457 RepID=UPI000E666DD0